MICQNCHERESTVHFTKIVNGQATQMHLCSDCAQQFQGLGLSMYPGMVADFLQALFGANVKGQPEQIGQLQQEKCPGCGKTFSQIQKSGRLGCSKCYDQFESQMELLLRRIHGRGAHVGKIPVRGGAAFRTEQERAGLKRRLQLLIEKEEFEEAAKVRDQIRELEKLSGGDQG